MIFTNNGEEIRVINENFGILGVKLNGVFLELLGSIVVTANILKEEGVGIEY